MRALEATSSYLAFDWVFLYLEESDKIQVSIG